MTLCKKFIQFLPERVKIKAQLAKPIPKTFIMV